MNECEVIGLIYKALGVGSSKELRAMARSKITPNVIRGCLIELSNVKKKLESMSRDEYVDKRQEGSWDWRSKPLSARDEQMVALVLDKRVIKTNAELADVLNSLGLDAKFHQRDGRPRMHKKLRREISELSFGRRRRALMMLKKRMEMRTETSAWFDAIRNIK